ncbi:MAG: LLM class flavin-dependent oxidoreductase [Armatimonadota bacterium]|nr:LLM class flavin-dependent oxidoreductase [Armatimonadota bacterium]
MPQRFGISIGVSPREPLERVREIASCAEAYGVEALWVIDFQLGMKDVYAALLLAAESTRAMSMGPGVTNLVTRDITVTANAICALHEVSGGRAMVGLGAGASAVYGAGQRPSRLVEMREGIIRLRRLLAGEAVAIAGREVRLATARGPVPIYVAASRPKMLQLAGELADGVIVMGAANREFVDWQLGFVHEGLARANRERGHVTIDLVVTMSMDNNEQQALDDVRPWATSEAWGYSKWPQLPAGFERFRSDFERAASGYRLVEHLSLHAEHRRLVSDEFVRAVAIAGDERTCLNRLRELAKLDVDRMTFALLPRGRLRRLEELAKVFLALSQ